MERSNRRQSLAPAMSGLQFQSNRRQSLAPEMSGLQFQSTNRLKTLEERRIPAQVALRSGRDLAMKGNGGTSPIKSEEDLDWTPSKKGQKGQKDPFY
jgi:hypothetical protein